MTSIQPNRLSSIKPTHLAQQAKNTKVQPKPQTPASDRLVQSTPRPVPAPMPTLSPQFTAKKKNENSQPTEKQATPAGTGAAAKTSNIIVKANSQAATLNYKLSKLINDDSLSDKYQTARVQMNLARGAIAIANQDYQEAVGRITYGTAQHLERINARFGVMGLTGNMIILDRTSERSGEIWTQGDAYQRTQTGLVLADVVNSSAESSVKVVALGAQTAHGKKLISAARSEKLAAFSKNFTTKSYQASVPLSLAGTGLAAWDLSRRQAQLKKAQQNPKKHDVKSARTDRNLAGAALAFSTVSSAATVQVLRNPAKAPGLIGISVLSSIASATAQFLSFESTRKMLIKRFSPPQAAQTNPVTRPGQNPKTSHPTP